MRSNGRLYFVLAFILLGTVLLLAGCVEESSSGDGLATIEWPEYHEEEFFKSVPLIIRARVEKRVRQLKDADLSTQKKEAVTEYAVEVIDTIKDERSSPTSRILLVQPGNTEFRYEGFPLLEIQGEYVLFLEEGFLAGKKQWMLTAPYSMYVIKEDETVQGMTGSPTAQIRENYEDFKRQVQTILGIKPEEKPEESEQKKSPSASSDGEGGKKDKKAND
jgi:hypothetical protein